MSDAIEFYFDFASPYGYFASTRLDAVAEKFGRACAWKPILLGPAFKASGNARLIDQPLKGAYSRHDWDRMARLMAVPYRFPEPFPVATLAAARAFWWLSDSAPERAKPFARAVFAAYFADGRDVSDKQVVADAGQAAGIARDALLAAIETPDCKARLKDETETAIAKGVFGSPFVIVGGEAFWGADRLWMVEEWLARGGW